METATLESEVIPASDREIIISRVFSAPRHLLWDVWTDPNHADHWWGPKGFTNTTHECSFVEGGVWRYTMHGPDGTDYKNRMRYVKIIPPEKIVCIHDGDDDTNPIHFESTVTFEAIGNKTRVTLHHLFPSAEARDFVVREHGAIEGGKQHLANLNSYMLNKIYKKLQVTVLSDRELLFERVFDAPRELVFKTMTDAATIPKWWGPSRHQTVVDKLDLRVGGKWRYIVKLQDGGEIAFNGEYREIEPPGKIVKTTEFEQAPGHFSVDTIQLEAIGNQTKFTATVLYASKSDRDSSFTPGMQDGANETYNRLEALLTKTLLERVS